jgi:hypothetical protein
MEHPSTPGFSCDLDIGYVRVWSGADGAQLLELVGEGLPGFDCPFPWGEAFGFALAGVGDWDLDGTPDVAVGAPGGGDVMNGWAGEVRVFRGADGTILRKMRGSGSGEFGISIAGGPDFDVDADGVSDLVVGDQDVSYNGVAGRAVVYSGADGSELRVLPGSGTFGQYGRGVGPGYAVAALRDFDGDGHSDVAVGNPIHASALGPGAGRVQVFSGRTWEELARVDGTSSWDYLGYDVAAPGDVNADGRSDVLLLAPATVQPSAYPRAVCVEGHE